MNLVNWFVCTIDKRIVANGLKGASFRENININVDSGNFRLRLPFVFLISPFIFRLNIAIIFCGAKFVSNVRVAEKPTTGRHGKRQNNAATIAPSEGNLSRSNFNRTIHDVSVPSPRQQNCHNTQ